MSSRVVRPAHLPGPPVRPGLAERIGDERATLGHDGIGQSRRAALAETVRVDQDGPGAPRCVRHPQDILILKAGISKLEPAIPAAPGRADPRVVPDLGKAPTDRGPGRDLREHALRQRVLCLDPFARRRSVSILERTVRVRDADPVIVIDLLRGRRHRVLQSGHGGLLPSVSDPPPYVDRVAANGKRPAMRSTGCQEGQADWTASGSVTARSWVASRTDRVRSSKIGASCSMSWPFSP